MTGLILIFGNHLFSESEKECAAGLEWGCIKKRDQGQITFLIRSWCVCGGLYAKQWLWFGVEGYVASSSAVAGRVEVESSIVAEKCFMALSYLSPHSSDGSTITITPPCALGILRCDTMSNTFICQLSWSHLLKIVQRNVVLYKMHWNLFLDAMLQNPFPDKI